MTKKYTIVGCGGSIVVVLISCGVELFDGLIASISSIAIVKMTTYSYYGIMGLQITMAHGRSTKTKMTLLSIVDVPH